MIDNIIEELNRAKNTNSNVKYISSHSNESITSIDNACEYIKKWIPELSKTEKFVISNKLRGNDIPSKVKNMLNVYIPYGKIYLKYFESHAHFFKIRDDKCRQKGQKGQKGQKEEDDIKIREYYDSHSENPILTGYICFMSILMYVMHFPNWQRYLEAISNITIIYLLVDDYIDDLDIDDVDKTKFIKQIYAILDNPSNIEGQIDARLIQCGILYNKVITQFPETKNGFLDAFKNEIEGLMIQSKNNLPLESYYENCIKKGGKFAAIIHYCIPESNYQDAYDYGSMIQLMDDCIDCINDIKNGHHTIATNEYIEKGNIDKLWLDIVNRINALNPKFTVIKFIYSFISILIVNSMQYCYSNNLINKIDNLSPFVLEERFICSKIIYNYIVKRLKKI